MWGNDFFQINQKKRDKDKKEHLQADIQGGLSCIAEPGLLIP